MDIAFLGLGIMGSRMAANLVRAGYHLTVWNRSPNKARQFVEMGAKQAETAAEAVRGVDVVITMLSTPEVVEEIAAGFLDGMQPNALWMDCSTVNPTFSRRMAGEAVRRGLRFIDAPVAGSKDPAEKGTLRFFAGGAAEDVAQVRPLMEIMGSSINHVGGHGMGAALKMVNNMLMAQAMLSFAEGLVLGEALGIPREKLFEYLQHGTVAQLALGKRAKIEEGTYEADFPLQWMQKDLHLAAVSGYEQGIALPSANVTKEVFMMAARAGWAEKDLSAVYQYLSSQTDANSGASDEQQTK